MNTEVSFFIVHNHPSNTTEPFYADLKLTESVKKASELLQLRLLDYIIVTENNHYSFKKNGLL